MDVKDHSASPDPTPEERAEAEAKIRDFMERQAAIPEEQKSSMDSPKYDGPIGQPADKHDDAAHRTD